MSTGTRSANQPLGPYIYISEINGYSSRNNQLHSSVAQSEDSSSSSSSSEQGFSSLTSHDIDNNMSIQILGNLDPMIH